MVLTVGPRHVGGSEREARLAALPLVPEVASIRVTGRRGYHSPLQAAAAALSLLLVIGIFTGAWAYLRWSSTLDEQFGTPEASMDPGELTLYRDAAGVATGPGAVTS